MKDVFFKNFSIVTMGLTVGKDVMNFHCMKFVQKLFLRLRIYYGLKFVNHELSNTKKKNRNKLKVAHLTLTPLKLYLLHQSTQELNCKIQDWC
jgi:hypothetical protein